MQLFKTILGIALGVLLTFFALQNTQPVSVYLLTLGFKEVPLFLVILLVFIVGFISGRLTGWAKMAFLRRK